MTLSIPCRQFNGISTPDTDKRNGVYVDPLSVELCLDCPLPDCHGAKATGMNGYRGPPRCAYEAAVMGRRNVTPAVTKRYRVKLPGPDPNGVMRAWECEVGP